MADLITIAPRVCFCSDVHVGIFDSILQGRHVVPMFPVLIPQVLCVKRSYDKGRYNDTVYISLLLRKLCPQGAVSSTRCTVFAKDLVDIVSV